MVGNLSKLRMLDLGHNRLRDLPISLGRLEGLSDFLYLHDNRLTQLPDSLSRLQRLRYLNISENAFEVFPEALLLELPVAKPPVLLLIVHLALLTPAVKLPLLAAYAVTVTSAIAAELINP